MSFDAVLDTADDAVAPAAARTEATATPATIDPRRAGTAVVLPELLAVFPAFLPEVLPITTPVLPELILRYEAVTEAAAILAPFLAEVLPVIATIATICLALPPVTLLPVVPTRATARAIVNIIAVTGIIEIVVPTGTVPAGGIAITAAAIVIITVIPIAVAAAVTTRDAVARVDPTIAIVIVNASAECERRHHQCTGGKCPRREFHVRSDHRLAV